MTWRQRLTKLEQRAPHGESLYAPHYLTVSDPERCQCRDCTWWRRERQREAEARDTVRELCCGDEALAVLDNAADDEVEELVAWATSRLNELENGGANG